MLLVVDHHDSFTWNLVHGLARWAERVEVVQSDEITIESVRALRPSGIVLSAGPGHVEQAQSTTALVRAFAAELPMLGVCLGHQIVCTAFGARLTLAPEVCHGRVSSIRHDGCGLFRGLPSPLPVARYHSWLVDAASLPAGLVPTAFAEGGELMAVRHRELPLCSVQFHPESFLTEHGSEMLRAFVHSLPPSSPSVARAASFALR